MLKRKKVTLGGVTLERKNSENWTYIRTMRFSRTSVPVATRMV